MALKIVGRSPRVSVSERRESPVDALHKTMKCSACGKLCFVTFPYYVTAQKRSETMKAALDEHRKVCTAGSAEDKRTYEILYRRA
jgi:hypothetical protein